MDGRSDFVTQVSRATSQTMRTPATQEGLVPLKAWVKMAMDRVIGGCFGEPDLEFYWVGDDAVDPLEQAQTISILVGAGVKTVFEARAELGLGQASGVVKFNPYHDEQGRFTTADGPGPPTISDRRKSDEVIDPVREDRNSTSGASFHTTPIGDAENDPVIPVQAPSLPFFSEPPVEIVPEPPFTEFPTDPTVPPGPGWEWRGNGPPGSNRGNWYNPNTGGSLHPDMDHDEPIQPHWTIGQGATNLGTGGILTEP